MVTKVFVPGKLFIAGEYAVVEPGNSALLVAVDKGIHITATENDGIGIVESGHFHEPLAWHAEIEGKLRFSANDGATLLINILKICSEYAYAKGLAFQPLKLEITSNLDDPSGTKYGLGSSGAVTVALVKVLNEHFKWDLEDLTIFKLALLATWSVQPNASGGDIAASTFGGWVFYTSPDRDSLLLKAAGQGLMESVQADWSMLSIERLPAPKSIKLSVGWTGRPVRTENRVASYATDLSYNINFIEISNNAVVRLRDAIIGDDANDILSAISDSKQNLLMLFSASTVEYQTPELAAVDRIAKQHGALAKISGAGGGDCAIVFSLNSLPVSRMLREWNQTGIVNLLLNVFEFEEHDD